VADGLNFEGESASLIAAGGTVTLVEGTSFCLCGRSGDIQPDSVQGTFFLDTRLLSTCTLLLDGQATEPLTVAVEHPSTGIFVSRSRPRAGATQSQLLVVRRRYVGRGMREDISIRNYDDEPVHVAVELCVDADFADVFAVKESRVRDMGEHVVAVDGSRITFRHRSSAVDRHVCLDFAHPDSVDRGRARWQLAIRPKSEWSTCVQLTVGVGSEDIEPSYRCGQRVDHSDAMREMSQWQGEVPILTTDSVSLHVAVQQSLKDLGSLRLFDLSDGRPVIAAGAPWFMTVFGRDSLLTAYMSLLADPELALGVLQFLAKYQGSRVDDSREEQPGRILHEVRLGPSASASMDDADIYYGTVDATPLFVVLLGELRHWGVAPDVVRDLVPHADRAMEWIGAYGDRDGDGYVEYERTTPDGLANQGWKDSWDGVPFADGTLPEPPIALCEVQGYVYAAYRARADIADEQGDDDTAARYRRKAAELKESFNRDFWLPDRGYFALALDGHKRPVDSLASNMGQCLWTGIVDDDKAASVAAHLLSPAMFSGWGIRTLATSMASYDPNSYHCGSVWPHDSALAAAGLTRYGFIEKAHRVALGLLDAATHLDGRLPELMSGLDRGDVPAPVSYPTSCSPQAWAAAAPLLLLRNLLRLNPRLPHGIVRVDPALPDGMVGLDLDRIPLGSGRMSVRVLGRRVQIGVPRDVALIGADGKPADASWRLSPG
jgi:glycogen debranching enzyme